MKLYKRDDTFFILPSVHIDYDKYYEGKFIYIDLNISWLVWSLCISIIDEE